MTVILRHENFTPHVDTSFSFLGWHGSLRLTRIELQRQMHGGGGRTPFTLIFQGRRDELLPEGMWTAQTEGGARFELYVMPIHTPVGDRQEYQAVFN